MKKVLDFNLIDWGNYQLTVGHVLIVTVIFLTARILIWLIGKAIQKRLEAKHAEAGRKYAVVQLVKYLLWTIAIIIMIQAAGFNITILLAGSAALLVGIGLGLQQTFNDFISGLILLVDRTIEINDVIEVDGMVVRVGRIGMRTSQVISRDEITIIVPNSWLTGNNVINWSHSKKRSRFNIPIGVAYGSDEEKVRKVLLTCAENHDLLLPEPAPFVRLEEFADSSVNFKLYFWTDDIFRVENIKSDLRFAIVKALKENDITIPFPQMDVYIKQLPPKTED